MKYVFLVPLCICVLFFSCAHLNSYNTYYNAIECYKGATSGKSPNVSLYDKCIEKCAKILTFYPNSRWVDDAIILSGKCFYAKGEKGQAETKFKELLNFYPESESAPEAEVMLGKIALERGDEIEAERWFEKASKEKKVKEEVDYWLTHSYFSAGNYQKAIEKGEVYLDSFKEGKFKADVLLILGDAADSLGRYENALNYYEAAISAGEKKFDLSLRMADIHLKMGNVEEAKKIYNSIEPENAKEEKILKKKMAFCFESERDYENAISSLLDVDDQESAFHIGIIYEKQINLQKALKAYTNAAKIAPNTDIGKIAAKKTSALQEILTLQEILGVKDTLQFDTTSLVADTLQANIVSDTLVGVIEDTTSKPDTIKDLAALRMRLAEIWLLEFGNSDGALKEYRTVLEEFPQSDYVPRALYAIAWIEQNIMKNEEDALARYRVIEKDYPDTDYAVAARRQIEGIGKREEGGGKREE
jgi:TolA-binding protein